MAIAMALHATAGAASHVVGRRSRLTRGRTISRVRAAAAAPRYGERPMTAEDSSRRSDDRTSAGRLKTAGDALRRAALAYHRRAISIPRIGRVANALARQIGSVRSLLDVGCGDGLVG